MTDYGQPVRFGLFLSPEAARLAETLDLAALADGAGLDVLGIQDHPYQARFLDTWTLMATVLARTQRVTVFPDVANLPLRPPAVLARTATSLDVLSGGRFELGLGAGAFWPAIAAMGGPNHSPREAGEALAEAVDVVRLLWSDQRSVHYEGRHYRLAGARPGPAPAHPLSIWLGVVGPRMLALLGRSADGWIPSSAYVPPEALPDLHARIDEAAAAAGREPPAIRRLYNVGGTITDGPSRAAFEGPTNQWVDTLTELVVDGGMDTFVFAPAVDDRAQVERFVDEVAPAVRETVSRHRRQQ